MKGFLSFLILWILSKRALNGAAIAEELAKRKGAKPSPGTLYPALKALQEKGYIQADDSKEYSLTSNGKLELDKSLQVFCQIFSDFREMKDCCGQKVKA
jgi:DNA-binding PadR family transcriptional regulator